MCHFERGSGVSLTTIQHKITVTLNKPYTNINIKPVRGHTIFACGKLLSEKKSINISTTVLLC